MKWKLLLPGLVVAWLLTVPARADWRVVVVIGSDDDLAAALMDGFQRGLELPEMPVSVLALKPVDAWGHLAPDLARMVEDPRVVAIVTGPDRVEAHVASQIGTRAGVPVLTLARDLSVHTTGSFWTIGIGGEPVVDPPMPMPTVVQSRAEMAARRLVRLVAETGGDRAAMGRMLAERGELPH